MNYISPNRNIDIFSCCHCKVFTLIMTKFLKNQLRQFKGEVNNRSYWKVL